MLNNNVKRKLKTATAIISNSSKEIMNSFSSDTSTKTAGALFKEVKKNLTKNEQAYAKPGEARRLEKKWQKFLDSRAHTTVSEYKQRRSVEKIEEIIPCMLCDNDTFMPLFTPTKKDWSYDVVMCSDCNLMFRNPNIIPEHLHVLYDKVNYNNFLSGKYSGNRQSKYRSVLASFKDLLPEKIEDDQERLSVLDFGCGNGLALEVMQKRGYETWGVDLSPESVSAAKELLGHERVWCGDPTEISELKGKKFDLITMWSVLAHLPRPIDTFKMLRSYLKPGGALLVFTVNANSLLLKRDHQNWNGFTRNHLAFYSSKTAELLFKKAGFGEFYTRPHYANVAATVRRKMPEKTWNTYKVSVLESQSGNMNRFLAFNSKNNK